MWTDARIKRLTKPGDHCVGNNLYFAVSKSGAKSYFFRYRRAGRRRDMGLGSTGLISLEEAREAALNCRKLLAKGGDPIDERDRQKAQARMAQLSLVSWDECVKRYAEQHSKGWAPGYAKRWTDGMARYATPVLGGLPIGAVDDQVIRRVLSPIWNEVPATAGKLRGWLEGVIDFAVSAGHRPAGLNPARWQGHLENVFAHPAKIKPVEHQMSLPYTEAPVFFAALKTDPSEVSRAMELIVLTGGRKSEVLKATWGQFDFDRKVWNVPNRNMKERKPHAVPLSTGMLEVLDEMHRRCGAQLSSARLVFPSSRPAGRSEKRLSEAAPQLLIKRLGWSEKTTVHGFRTSLQCFIAECTTISSDARRLMIAHTIGGEVEQAYMRSDLREQRRKGYEAWSAWLNGQSVDPSVALPRISGRVA